MASWTAPFVPPGYLQLGGGDPNKLAGNLSQQGAGFQNRYAPGVGTPASAAARANALSSANSYQQQMQELQAQANGTAPPSVAQRQLAQGGQMAQGGQTSLAHAGPVGGGGALALRNAGYANARIGTTTANNSAALGAQERAQASNEYSRAAQQLQGMGQAQQGIDYEGALAQGKLNQQQSAENDAQQLGYQGMSQDAMGAQLGADSSNYAAGAGYQQQGAYAAAAARNQLQNQIIGATITGASAAFGGAASDIRVKHDIAPAGTITSDARAKEDAHAAGMAEGYQRAAVASHRGMLMVEGGKSDPTRPMMEPPMRPPLSVLMAPPSQAAPVAAMTPQSTLPPPPLPPQPPPPPPAQQQPLAMASDARANDAIEERMRLQGRYGRITSDERGKSPDGGSFGTEADAFLDHLHPYTYRYKDPAQEPSSQPTGGQYLGVMAQDVERVPGIGPQIVKDTPHGKVLEGGALASGMAAGIGRLNERVRMLEGRR